MFNGHNTLTNPPLSLYTTDALTGIVSLVIGKAYGLKKWSNNVNADITTEFIQCDIIKHLCCAKYTSISQKVQFLSCI